MKTSKRFIVLGVLSATLLGLTATAAQATGPVNSGAVVTAPDKTPEWLSQEKLKLAAVVQQTTIIPYTTGTYTHVLGLKFKLQETSYYCAPASAQAMLSNLIANVPSQSTLAGKFGTTVDGGTIFAIIPSVLNNYYQSTFPYVFDQSTNPAQDLFNRALTDVDAHNMSQMLAVRFGMVPWRNTGNNSGHAIVSYGWYNDTLDQVKGLYIWDPWDGGRYTPTNTQMFSAISQNGRGLVW